MAIKQILDTIAAISGKKDKIKELTKHKDNELLKQVIYLAHSPRIKFYIKHIPDYPTPRGEMGLDSALEALSELSSRKVTGHSAIGFLTHLLSSVSVENAIVIERVIGKDLKIGMDSSINDVIPKLIEETPYQGAKSFSEKGALKLFEKGKDKKTKVVISQIKADGTYRNAIIRSGEVELISRQGEVSYLEGAKFLNELSTLEDCVLNGELTIDGMKRTVANGMVTSIMDIIEGKATRSPEEIQKKYLEFEKKHGRWQDALDRMRFIVWDKITVDEYFAAESSTPYIERFKALEETLSSHNLVQVEVVETRYITTYAEAIEHFLDAQKRGLEGTIIKSSEAGWKDGKPTYQIKLKLEMNMDLRIIGFEYGNKGTKNEHVISRIKLESSCGKLKTAPSGMTEEMMKDITERQKELVGTIVEIRCCGLSQDSDGNWSTQHPSIVELRTDKDTCDSLESCIEIENMAKGMSKKVS